MFSFVSLEDLAKRILQVTFSPWYVTHGSMAQLLNASDEPDAGGMGTVRSNSKDRLTTWWIERKLAELSFVGVTCALVAGVIAAAFSWRDLDKIAWGTRGLWYGSIVMVLTSICLATQQTLALHRLCCHDKKLRLVQRMLCKAAIGNPARFEPSWTQLFLWQSAIMLLNIGISLFLIGLVIQIITDLSDMWSPANERAFALFFISGIFSASVYVTSSAMLYRASRMAVMSDDQPETTDT